MTLSLPLSTPQKILIIRHGALGDVLLALSPIAAIRAQYPKAHITILTTKSFSDFLRASHLVNDVWEDKRLPFWRLDHYIKLRKKIRRAQFDFVFDLQTSNRTAFYFHFLFAGFPWRAKPNWSGIVKGCSHPHITKDRHHMHAADRWREQLEQAGIQSHHIKPVDLSFARSDLAKFDLPENYALLVPGGSAHRPQKRWPAKFYAEIANWLITQNITPLLIGGKDDEEPIATIRAACPQARSLLGQTNLLELAEIGTKARLALGNDTGPTHVLAAAGAPSLVLFSDDSMPSRSAPKAGACGNLVLTLQENDLQNLAIATVKAEIETLLS